ncbi:hypothetical protein X975_05794, partial [Stegodyphus mimosarum]
MLSIKQFNEHNHVKNFKYRKKISHFSAKEPFSVLGYQMTRENENIHATDNLTFVKKSVEYCLFLEEVPHLLII